MNIYACWHQGVFGYCFLSPYSGWWFVPELEQPDPAIYRNLRLDDLIFINPAEFRHERQLEQQHGRRSLLAGLRNLLRIPQRAHTVGGLLLLPRRTP